VTSTRGPEDHGRRQDDVAAYLVGALDEAEARELERHLAGCGECRERVEWLRPAAELLPESVERVEPPAELRQRVIEQVRAEGSAGRARPAPRGRLRGVLRRPAAGLAAAAVIVAAIAGYAVGTGGDGTETIRAADASASLERSGDSGTLQMTGLQQLAAGEVYQAWVQRDGRIEPSSLFAARGDGSASAAIPDGLDGAEAVLVTIEPRGGSSEPTSAPIVAVPLSG
jgi:anti-sigma-K factor RskA